MTRHVSDPPPGDASQLRSALHALARQHQISGVDQIREHFHARLVLQFVRAFGDEPLAEFFVETRAGSARIPRPDLILLHPAVGVLVVENKGVPLDAIQGVAGTTLTLLRDGQLRKEDPFQQAQRVMFRLGEMMERFVPRGEMVMLHTVAFPRIGREDFERRFEVRWPAETLFAAEIDDPARLRRAVEQYADAMCVTARRGSRLTRVAMNAARTVLNGRAFLKSPREAAGVGDDPELLGHQIETFESAIKEPTQQQREFGSADFRGTQRLFRGVAGSGKSVMLSLNAASTLNAFVSESAGLFEQDRPSLKRVLVVCFNRTLVHYLRQRIHDRYTRLTWDSPPADRLTITHIEALIRRLARQDPRLDTGLDFNQKELRVARLIATLDQMPADERHALGYDAIFIDEAQDLLPEEVAMLHRLARPDEKGRSTFVVFYDNAQNIYARPLPVWEKLGLNFVGGRTVFLDQCLRNTREVLSLAFNVLVGADAPAGVRVATRQFADVQSLRERGLIEEIDGCFDIRFAPRQGDHPTVDCFDTRDREIIGVAREIGRLIHQQKVLPGDILVLFKSYQDFGARLAAAIQKTIGPQDAVREVHGLNRGSKDQSLLQPGTLTLSTIASAKGYDAPVVFVTGVDRIDPDPKGRATFYVAATRARMLLKLSGVCARPSLLDEVTRTAARLGPAARVVWHAAGRAGAPSNTRLT